MATDRRPLYFNPTTGGFALFNGEDSMSWNFTSASGDPMHLQVSAADVFTVRRDGTVFIDTIDSTSNSALEVRGNIANALLHLIDKDNGVDLLRVFRSTFGASWGAELFLDAPDAADAVGLQITYDAQSVATPTGDILRIGYTNDSQVFQERFRFEPNGALQMGFTAGSNLLWNTDGAGTIGGSADNRPSDVYAATSVVGDSTVIKANVVQIGPADASSKRIEALAASAPYPALRFNGTAWDFSNDGTTFETIVGSATSTWDNIYDNSIAAANTTLEIDTADTPLYLLQTSTSGSALRLRREQAVTTGHVIDIYNGVSTTGDNVSSVYANQYCTAAGTGVIKALARSRTNGAFGTDAFSAFQAAVFGAIGDNPSAKMYAFRGSGSTTGGASKYGLYLDANFTWGTYVLSKSIFEIDAGTTGAILVESTTTGASNLASGSVEYFRGEIVPGTDTGGAYYCFNAVAAATTATTYGFRTEGGFDYGLYTESKVTIYNPSSISTPTMMELTRADVIAAQTRIELTNTPSNSNGTQTRFFEAIWGDGAGFGGTPGTSYGFYASVFGDVNDVSGSNHYAAYFTLSANNGSATTYGLGIATGTLFDVGVSAGDASQVSGNPTAFSADNNWTYALAANSPVDILVSLTAVGSSGVHSKNNGDGTDGTRYAFLGGYIDNIADTSGDIYIGFGTESRTPAGAPTAYGFFAEKTGWNVGFLGEAVPSTLSTDSAAFAADNSWTYALTATSPIYILLSSAAASAKSIYAKINGDGTDGTRNAFLAGYIDNIGDTSGDVYIGFGTESRTPAGAPTAYGYYAAKTGWNVGFLSEAVPAELSTDSAAFAADNSWTYSLIANAPISLNVSSTAAGSSVVYAKNGGGGADGTRYAFLGTYADGIGDTSGDVYIGFGTEARTRVGSPTSYGFMALKTGWDIGFLAGSAAPTLSGSTAAFAANNSFTYGVFVEQKSYIGHTITTASGNQISTQTDMIASVAQTSGDKGVYLANVTTHASDTSGATYLGYTALITAAGVANKWGFNASSDWGVGFLAGDTTTPPASTLIGYYADDTWAYGFWSRTPARVQRTVAAATITGYEFDVTSTGITTNNDIGFLANYNGHASDTTGHTFYGVYVTADTTGAARRVALATDSDLDYGLMLGSTTAPPSSIIGCYVDDSWTYSNYSLAKALWDVDTTGSINTIDTTITAASGLTDANVSVYRGTIVPHASDNVSTNYYAFQAVGSSTGISTKYAFQTNNDLWHWGVNVKSHSNLFQRTTTWSSATAPVVTIENLNTGAGDNNSTLKCIVNRLNDGTYAVEMDTAETSVLEGHRNAIGLTNAATVKVCMDTGDFVPNFTAADTQDFYFRNQLSGASQFHYWSASGSGATAQDRYIGAAIRIPTQATLTDVSVSVFNGLSSLPAADADKPRVEVFYHATGANTVGTLIAVAYATGIGTETISVSTSTVCDRSIRSFYVRYKTAAANVSGVPNLRTATFTYTINDLGVGIGTTG